MHIRPQFSFAVSLLFFLVAAQMVCAQEGESLRDALRAGRYSQAIADSLTLAATPDGDADQKARALFFAARIEAIHRKDPAAARTHLWDLLERYPDTRAAIDAKLELAILNGVSGNLLRAKTQLEAFLAAYPAHPRRPAAALWLRQLQGEAVPVSENRPVRIAVPVSEDRLRCEGNQLRVTDPATGRRLYEGDHVLIRISPQGTLLLNAHPAPQPVDITSSSGKLRIQEQPYRETLRVSVMAGKITVVNRMPLETYLMGVVPSEMPATWPMEALKAQAVAARTYARYMMEAQRFAPFDLQADTRSQVHDITRTHSRSSAAVKATTGQVIKVAGRPILAGFHADSGGYTETAAAVWDGAYPYLTARKDRFSNNTPYSTWEITLTGAAIRNAIDGGKAIGRILSVTARETTPSGRVKTVLLTGTKSELRIPAHRFRAAMGAVRFKSTRFTVTGSHGSFRFTGSGFGHGIGMSQWGAKAMAEKGADYKKILRFYYGPPAPPA